MKSVLQTFLMKVFERPKRVDLIKQTVKCTVVGCLFHFIPSLNDLIAGRTGILGIQPAAVATTVKRCGVWTDIATSVQATKIPTGIHRNSHAYDKANTALMLKNELAWREYTVQRYQSIHRRVFF